MRKSSVFLLMSINPDLQQPTTLLSKYFPKEGIETNVLLTYSLNIIYSLKFGKEYNAFHPNLKDFFTIVFLNFKYFSRKPLSLSFEILIVLTTGMASQSI